MNNNKHLFSFIILICFFQIPLIAQEAVLSAGSETTGSAGEVSFSVGQVSYISNSGVSGSVSEGVQQAYEISVTTGINETDISLDMSAYPNPTRNNLILTIDNIRNADELYYLLFDMNGKLLIKKQIISRETKIEMGSFSTAVYFINVTNNSKIVKTFKITKI
jgi:Secretion system C-terminal sorting domain